MRRTKFISAPLLIWAAIVMAKGPSSRALDVITAADARSHLQYLASDFLMGRDTPSAGLDKAAEYIACQFQASGLAPAGSGYFQYYDLNQIFLGDTSRFSIQGPDGVRHEYELKKQFMPYEMTANKTCRGEIVFAGYGITAPEAGYDDYANLDVTGKIVFVLKRGPRQEDPASPFYVKKDVPSNRIDEKIKNALEHGAVGIMLVTDPLYNRLLTPRGFPWPNLYKGFPMEATPVTLAKMEDQKIPAIQVGEETMKLLFGSLDALKRIQKSIDSTMTPSSRPLGGFSAEIQTTTRRKVITTRNVVAVCPGQDPVLKDEWVVVGAHYDHLGIKKNTTAGQDSIYNGADDNGSGTVALLQIAEALAAGKNRPQRSILFIAFSGEEKGLFGSNYYVSAPLFPLEKTVAMVNFDMIGRNNPDSLLVWSNKSSSMLVKMVRDENKSIGMKINYNPSVRGSSDHAPFFRKGIPVVCFHTDEHPDYHQVSDEVDKIDFGKIARIDRLGYRTVWTLANTPVKPKFEGKK